MFSSLLQTYRRFFHPLLVFFHECCISLYQHRNALFAILTVFVLVSSIPEAHVHAFDIKQIFNDVINSILDFFLNFFLWLLERTAIIFEAVVENTDVLHSELVNEPWMVIRDTANITFIGVLLVIAAANIIGYETDTYSISSAMPKLIMAIIAVNFSKIMVGVILDFFNVITGTLYNFVGGGLGKFGGLIGYRLVNMYAQVGNGQILQVSTTTDQTGLSTTANVTNASWEVIVLIILIAVTWWYLTSLVITFVVRMVWLWVLTVTSPLYFLGMSAGYLESLKSMWWDKFWKYAVMQVKIAGVLSIVFRIHFHLMELSNGKRFDLTDAIAEAWQGKFQLTGLTNVMQLIGFIIVIMGIQAAFKFGEDEYADGINGWLSDKIFKPIRDKAWSGTKWAAYHAKWIPHFSDGKVQWTSAKNRVEGFKLIGEEMKKNMRNRSSNRESSIARKRLRGLNKLTFGGMSEKYKNMEEQLKNAQSHKEQNIAEEETKLLSGSALKDYANNAVTSSGALTAIAKYDGINAKNILTSTLKGNRTELDLEGITEIGNIIGDKHTFGGFVKQLKSDLENDQDPVKKAAADAVLKWINQKIGENKFDDIEKFLQGELADPNITYKGQDGTDKNITSIQDEALNSYRSQMQKVQRNLGEHIVDRSNYDYLLDESEILSRNSDGTVDTKSYDRLAGKMRHYMKDPETNKDKIQKVLQRLTPEERESLLTRMKAQSTFIESERGSNTQLPSYDEAFNKIADTTGFEGLSTEKKAEAIRQLLEPSEEEPVNDSSIFSKISFDEIKDDDLKDTFIQKIANLSLDADPNENQIQILKKLLKTNNPEIVNNVIAKIENEKQKTKAIEILGEKMSNLSYEQIEKLLNITVPETKMQALQNIVNGGGIQKILPHLNELVPHNADDAKKTSLLLSVLRTSEKESFGIIRGQVMNILSGQDNAVITKEIEKYETLYNNTTVNNAPAPAPAVNNTTTT